MYVCLYTNASDIIKTMPQNPQFHPKICSSPPPIFESFIVLNEKDTYGMAKGREDYSTEGKGASGK